MLTLSVLDQSVVSYGQPQGAAIRHTLALAQRCEEWGYGRFWVSEHHNLPSIAGTAPEVLLAAIAARTSRIRLGSAGVMLPHYAPFKVAEQFRVLDALAPGRIDLGLGRAPGSDSRTSQLLNPDRYASERFPQQVQELQAWVSNHGFGRDHPGYGVVAQPTGVTTPSLWILGSSNYGAQLAAHLGLPYAFAYFFSDGVGVESALEMYRSQFQPSAYLRQPQATICVSALAADTEEQAWYQFQSRARWRLERNRGRVTPLLPPDMAVAGLSAEDAIAIDAMRPDALAGTADQVADQMRILAARLELDELVVCTWAHDPAVQARSFALLAQAFALTGREAQRVPELA
jgi:luciferase family oxidoreductase group 1